MNEIRILTIVPYRYLPAKLGGEKCINFFNQYLGEKVPVVAVATKGNETRTVINYKVIKIFSESRARYIDPLLYFRLKKIIKENSITHVMLEHPYYAWLGFLLRKTLPVKLLIHSHNIEYMRSKSIGRWWWKALKWYEEWAYKISDLNFFISEDDMEHAIREFALFPSKNLPVTYGIEAKELPGDRPNARRIIEEKYGIGKEERILLFNGALYHHTNYDAVTIITREINPVLLKQETPYKIFICGKGLPDSFNELKAYQDKNIIYAGFVDDISIYFKAADIFLNPIQAGGGVKTKAIEALSYNCTVISTELGALGIKREVCGDKLHITKDEDWKGFNELLLENLNNRSDLPSSFFEYYYWGNIADAALEGIRKLV